MSDLFGGNSSAVERPVLPEGGGSIPTLPLQKSPFVRPISRRTANALLRFHYLGPVSSSFVCFGHKEGCTVWAVPRSRAVHDDMREAGFDLVELVRMVGTPGHTWAMSSLLSHSIRCLFKMTRFDAAITYADREMNHTGATYLAANWRQIEDAQPDGFSWSLDGRRISRKHFYKKYGSSSLGLGKMKYGDRLNFVPDIPKKRFIMLKNWSRFGKAETALAKIKTWGAARIASK